MTPPRVSVVIPTFNRAIWLMEALKSVREQSFQDFEIVVADDGSTDGTWERIKQLQGEDPRVRYVRQENRGPSAARNLGISAARGEFIALLDSDDLWLPEKLARQMAAFDADPSAGVVYCKFAFITESGEPLERDWPRPQVRGDLYVDLMYANVIYGSDSAVVMRTADLRRAGGFDERLHAVEDQDLWRRLSLSHRFVLLDEVLVLVRVHPASIQQNIDAMALGMLRHVTKLFLETPPQYRSHLSDAVRNVASEITVRYRDRNQFGKMLLFLVRLARQGPVQRNTVVSFAGKKATRIPRWLARALYRRSPESLKAGWRRLKGRP
jgi:glycosyltransferase involved in cell wall biosynthesis